MSNVLIDWDNLTFSITPTKEMAISKCSIDGKWTPVEYIPYGNISISPAAGILNYGQGLFEGLKALRTKNNEVVLFRPIENAKRMEAGCKRLCMPIFPSEEFVKTIKELVKRNIDYLPPYKKGSLYIRPLIMGTGAILGVAPAPEYTFLTYVSPVGPYFKGGMTLIKLEIIDDYHRAAPNGTGGVKAASNYVSGMLPSKRAKERGYSEVIFLDAKHCRYIEEVGAANFFCVINDILTTPRLTGTILPGITRDSIITIAKDKLNLKVEERDIDYKEVSNASEAFCCGTGAVISPIGSIAYKNEVMFNKNQVGEITKTLYDLLTKIQRKEEEDPYGWVENVI